MGMDTYTGKTNKNKTPQSEPIPGKNMVQNSAGGFTFAVDDFTRLNRFLILGTEGGSYYASEKVLTKDNAKAVEKCITADGPRTVKTIVEISESGRAPKNDPAIFALAMCLKLGNDETRQLAAAALPRVCRIGTHVFQMAKAVDSLGGWGRLTKKAFSSWYLEKEVDALAHQLVKYQSREGWSHRDMLRKLHINPKSNRQLNNSFKWAVGKMEITSRSALPAVIKAFEMAKEAKTADEIVTLIEKFELPREAIPTQFLNDKSVWQALLTSGTGMPMTAMIRNLGKMSEIGLLSGMNANVQFVVNRLLDDSLLEKARIHPMQILIALKTYQSGHGMKGSLSWTVNSHVVDALDDAFYKSFKFVKASGKRFLLGIDISGSMDGGSVAGSSLTPREAAAAMAMVAMRTERFTESIGFTAGSGGYFGRSGGTNFEGFNTGITKMEISKNDKLDKVTSYMRGLPMGGTDCALPMIYALKNKLEIDCFVVYTDNETWAGNIAPVQALKQYRKATGINAKLIVVGLVGNNFTIADPSDAGMLDVVGFDSSAPVIMADFARE